MQFFLNSLSALQEPTYITDMCDVSASVSVGNSFFTVEENNTHARPFLAFAPTSAAIVFRQSDQKVIRTCFMSR